MANARRLSIDGTYSVKYAMLPIAATAQTVMETLDIAVELAFSCALSVEMRNQCLSESEAHDDSTGFGDLLLTGLFSRH